MATLEPLAAAWEAWAELGAGLDEQQWQRPTRLHGWRVADVYAHHAAWPVMVAKLCDAPPVHAPPAFPDAAALLAMFNAPGGVVETASELNRDQAVALAGSHSREELVDGFRTAAPAVLAAAQDADRRIQYGPFGAVALREALRVGLMEAVVHYLDLARALDLPVPGPVGGEALREVVVLLAQVADPLAFVERATGRSAMDVLPVVR
jgi:uncharacterized protein (TIGR03083 family)